MKVIVYFEPQNVEDYYYFDSFSTEHIEELGRAMAVNIAKKVKNLSVVDEIIIASEHWLSVAFALTDRGSTILNQALGLEEGQSKFHSRGYGWNGQICLPGYVQYCRQS